MKVWTEGGSLLGTLRQGEEYAGKDWKFAIDYEAKQRERMERSHQVIDEIDNEGQGLIEDNDDGDGDDEEAEEEEEKEWGDTYNVDHLLQMDSNLYNKSNSKKGDLGFGEARSRDDDGTSDLRRTPKLHPVNGKYAGRGFSATPKMIKRRLKK